MQQVTPLYLSVAVCPALVFRLPAQHMVQHDLTIKHGLKSRVCFLDCVGVLQKAVTITTAAP